LVFRKSSDCLPYENDQKALEIEKQACCSYASSTSAHQDDSKKRKAIGTGYFSLFKCSCNIHTF